MSVPALDFDAPRARRNAIVEDGAFERRAPEIAEAAPDAQAQPAAPRRKGLLGRIGDWFGGLPSRFRNWRLRNTASTEGSEILNRVVDEITTAEGGYNYGEDRDNIVMRMARKGLLNGANGVPRAGARVAREKPMRQDADPEAAKRFWRLDSQLGNLGRRADEPVAMSHRYVPRRLAFDPASEAGRASGGLASKGAASGFGLGFAAEMLQMRGTKEAAQAARSGKPFTGLTFGDQSRWAVKGVEKRHAPKDKGQIIPEAQDESMEEDGAHDDDLASMEFDKDA